MSNEEFSKIQVDNTATLPQWEGPVPQLNYWSYAYGRNVMTTEQTAFYRYFKANIEQGNYVPVGEQYSYVSIYKDELLKKFKSRYNDRAAIVAMARRLVSMYKYKGSDLDKIVAAERDVKRSHRVRRLSRTPVAEWVMPGRNVRYGDRDLVRGGFYLGTHIRFYPYKYSLGRFTKTAIDTEGPVIVPDFDPATACEAMAGESFSTFSEMRADDRKQLLDWLAGGDSITPELLRYYLGGIEMRLLGDSTTTDAERRELLEYLVDLRNDPSLPSTLDFVSAGRRIGMLIDITLALFFPDECDTICPYLDMSEMPLTQMSRVGKILRGEKVDPATKNRLVGRLVDALPIPVEFPEVFHDAFRHKLSSELSFRLGFRGRMEYFEENKGVYQPMARTDSYFPEQPVYDALRINTVVGSSSEQTAIRQVMISYMNLLESIKKFIVMRRLDSPIMALINALPPWCDAKLMPGIADAAKNLQPLPGEKFRMVPVMDMLAELGLENYVGDGKYIDFTYNISYQLAKFGLAMGYPESGLLPLKPDDTVAIFDNGYGRVPTRGTFMISLYLVAWLMQADAVTRADYAVVDRWIADYDAKGDWAVPAQGILRWLCSRKLTLTRKRKIKAHALAKTVKRRQSFMQMVLELFADPERISVKRMKRLETLYTLMDMDTATIHSDLHRMATTGTAMARTAGRKNTALDKTRLSKMAQSTLMAQKILADVFNDEARSATDPAPDVPKRQSKASADSKGPKKPAANATLMSLLEELAARDEWSRGEFDEVCRRHALAPGAALERLNDMAYGAVDEGVADDDGDNVYIDIDIATQLLNK